MRMITPAARNVGHPMKPMKGTCSELVMNCTAMSVGMRMAAIVRMPLRSLTAREAMLVVSPSIGISNQAMA